MNVNAILTKHSLHFNNHLSPACSNNELSRMEKKIFTHLADVLSEEIEDVKIDHQLDMMEEEYDFEADITEHEEIGNSSKYSLEIMQIIVHKWFVLKKRPFSSVQHDHRLLANKNTIYRYRKYINNGGTKYMKIFELKEKLFEKLKIARESILPIHDIDLKRWALEIANDIGLSRQEFNASDTFIDSFKQKFKIVSRKVTKFVNRKDFISSDEIEDRANAFTLECREKCAEFERSKIFNFDQSGINYEMTIGRTLSHKGERRTFCLTKSSNAISHSFTICPVLSAEGEFLPKLFVILQEKDGEFGPQVRLQVNELEEKLRNVHVVATRSGKMLSSLTQDFKDNVLSLIYGNYLMIHDGWRGQTNDSLFQDLPNMERMIIPDGTTDRNQPLDITVFRQWKKIGKSAFMRVNLDQMDIDLRSRAGVLTLQSLIFNQLRAPVFKPMLRKSWEQYFDDNYVEDPLTVKDISFKDLPLYCGNDDCNHSSFIRCAWCEDILCFRCFFLDIHIHN
jgi:hypothetical protein